MASEPLTPEQSKLAGDSLPLAQQIANYACRDRVSPRDLHRREDAFSDACLSICTSTRDYDPRSGTFSSHAWIRALHDAKAGNLRPGRRLIGRPGVAEAADNSSGHEARADAQDAAETLLRRLPRKVATALRLVALDGLTQEEAARRMGCSPPEVRRLLRLARSLAKG